MREGLYLPVVVELNGETGAVFIPNLPECPLQCFAIFELRVNPHDVCTLVNLFYRYRNGFTADFDDFFLSGKIDFNGSAVLGAFPGSGYFGRNRAIATTPGKHKNDCYDSRYNYYKSQVPHNTSFKGLTRPVIQSRLFTKNGLY